MPRAPSVTVADAIEALKEYSEHFSRTELPQYTSPVWNAISNRLGGKWSAHNAYSNVREDRRQILTLARKELGICLPDVNNNSNNDSLIDTSGDMTISNVSKVDDGDPDYKKQPDFYLTIKKDLWQIIKPEVPVEYSDRRYLILKPGVWTHKIFYQFWKQFRLPCAYAFKRAKIHPSPEAENYMKIVGRCISKQCSNIFKGYVQNEPGQNVDVIVEVHTRDTSYDDHEEVKRPLAGQEREEISKDLVAEGCSNWRKRIAREEMDIGDIEPPILYNPDVGRQAKKEKLEKDLGVKKADSRDIVRAIEDMMDSGPYAGSVQGVGSNPFYTFYESQVQVHAYKEFRRLRRDSAFISIDATGSVVLSLARGPNSKSGHIFLYSIVVNFDGRTIAVNQMLSEKNEMEFIEFWLRQWVRHVPKPPEAVCDYSRALLCALALAFNNQTTKAYVDTCFRFLMDHKGSTETTFRPANTFIRVDVAHLIHLVTRWKCFTAIRQTAIKDFYIRCVALMVDCQTFDDLQEIYLLTSIVAIHPYNGYTSDEDSDRSAQYARTRLEGVIAERNLDTGILLQNDENKETSDLEDYVCDEAQPINRIEQWVEELQSIAKEGIGQKRGDLNPFYLPEFFKHLQRIMREFPLWTGVMIPYFQSKYKHASSSSCEGYFNDLKTRVMSKYGKPLRADKFVKMHLQDLSGGARLFASKLICYRMTDQNRNNDLKSSSKSNTNVGMIHENANSEDIDLLSVDNWKNKASKIRKTSSAELEDILPMDTLCDEDSDIDKVCSAELLQKSTETETCKSINETIGLNEARPDMVNLDPNQCAPASAAPAMQWNSMQLKS